MRIAATPHSGETIPPPSDTLIPCGDLIQRSQIRGRCRQIAVGSCTLYLALTRAHTQQAGGTARQIATSRSVRRLLQ